YVKRDFRWYEVLSRLILETLRKASPTVEYYSVDEMFFDAGTLSLVFRQPLADAVRSLQLRLLQEARVPVSIGVSLSKTLAKLASDACKPFGCLVLPDRAAIRHFLSERSVEEISGIGPRSAAKLATHGILTCWDFARARKHFIRKLLTIKGEYLWHEVNGTPAGPI